MTVIAQVRLFLLVYVMIVDELVTLAVIIALVKQVQHVVAMITSSLAINVQIRKMELIKNQSNNEMQINKYWLME